jgi:ABC-type nitrate/sulfonate/bicarbonate transport system substrate-binding protein
MRYGVLFALVFLAAAMWHGAAGAQRIRVASSSPSLTARLPHLVAHEEGFFKQQGLEVESIVVRNDSIILAALAAGEFNYVETGAPSPVAAIAKGLPFVIVGGFRTRLDYIMIGRKGFSSTDNLKGAVIGATGAGGLSESVVIAAMRSLGFQRDRDYKILYVGNSPLRMLALEQGRIDASIFTPHQQLILLQKGYHAIVDVGKLLPEIPSLLLTTTRDKANANPDVAVRFLRAIHQAMEFIKNNPDRAIEDARKQKYSGDMKIEREALKYYADTFSISVSAKNIEALMDISGIKDTKMKPGDFLDARFAEKAMAGK